MTVSQLPAPQARSARCLWGALFGAIFFSGVFLATGLWYSNRQASRGVESFLRRRVFDDPTRRDFKSVHLNLWRGRLSLEGILWRREGAPWAVDLSVDRVSAWVPLRDLFSGRGQLRTLTIEKPVLRLTEKQTTSASSHRLAWPAGVSVTQLRLSDGQVNLGLAGGRMFSLDEIEAEITGLGQEPDVARPLAGRVEGVFGPEKAGTWSGRFSFREPMAPLSAEGELRLERVELPKLVGALFPAAGVRVESGTLDLKSQIAVVDDRLTASHLVEIRDLKIDPGDRKRILGLSVNRLKDLLEIDYLSFVVPMSGSLDDPQIGIASSVEQILYKVLEGKVEDPEDLRKWSRRGGQYLGNKIDRAFREWLADRRARS